MHSDLDHLHSMIYYIYFTCYVYNKFVLEHNVSTPHATDALFRCYVVKEMLLCSKMIGTHNLALHPLVEIF